MDTNDVHPFTVASIEASGGFEWTTNPVATALAAWEEARRG